MLARLTPRTTVSGSFALLSLLVATEALAAEPPAAAPAPAPPAVAPAPPAAAPAPPAPSAAPPAAAPAPPAAAPAPSALPAAPPAEPTTEAGQAPQQRSLQEPPTQAVLYIDPIAPDAVLYVDGQPRGTGPQSVELSVGRHVLELRRPNYKTQRLIYEAKAGDRKPLKAGPYVAVDAKIPAAVTPSPTSQPQAGEQKPPAGPPAKLAPEQEKESPYQGIFGDLFVPVMLGGASTHSYTSACPADTYGGTCSTSAPRGGGLGLRLGYFYEWVGLELLGAAAVDVSSAELALPQVSNVSQQMLDLAGRSVFVRAGGLLGGGLRVTTPLQGIRFTVGADYVWIMRRVFTIPDSVSGATLTYSVPGFFLDGGIQLGSTPGARFYLGAFLLIENANDLNTTRDLSALGIDTAAVPTELTTMSIYRGRQYFYGPLLGIAFGH